MRRLLWLLSLRCYRCGSYEHVRHGRRPRVPIARALRLTAGIAARERRVLRMGSWPSGVGGEGGEYPIHEYPQHFGDHVRDGRVTWMTWISDWPEAQESVAVPRKSGPGSREA